MVCLTYHSYRGSKRDRLLEKEIGLEREAQSKCDRAPRAQLILLR